MPKTNDLFRALIREQDPDAKIYLTENYNSFSKKKKDLFGFVDFIVFNSSDISGSGYMTFYQITSPGNVYSRARKIAEDDTMLDIVRYLVTNNQLVLIWGKDKTKEVCIIMDSEEVSKQQFSIKPREMIGFSNVKWDVYAGDRAELRERMRVSIESLIKCKYTKRG